MGSLNKAVLYLRVSSKEQENGYSLDAQEKLAVEYARKNNFETVKMYKVSESAYKTDRKYFNQMINFVKKHSVKNIVFDITDRMTRNTLDRVKIDTLIKEHNITVHFARTNKTYNRDSRPDEGFMFDIDVAVAKKLSADIALKTKMGVQEKLEQGGFCGKSPVGYLNNVADRTIILDPVRAPLVKRAFELYSTAEHSVTTITDKMFEEGLRGRTGTKYARSKMFNLLRNPVYYGMVKYNGKIYKGTHEPIISEELFNIVQGMFTKRTKVNIKRTFAFGGLVECSACGCRLTPAIYKKHYLYYHCTFARGRHENAPYLTEEKLSIMFGKTIENITLTDFEFETMKQALKTDCDGSVEAVENRLKSLSVEEKALEARLSRLYDEKLDKTISEAFWKAKHDEYEAKLTDIDRQIRELKKNSAYHYKEGLSLLEPLKSLKSLYESSDSFGKAELLKIVSSNHTFSGENLMPVYKKPYSYIAEQGQKRGQTLNIRLINSLISSTHIFF
jgi:site-specific DNA recombinase